MVQNFSGDYSELVPYSGLGGLRNPQASALRAGLAADTSISPRQLGGVSTPNNGEVSPFTSNPFMVVNYGKEKNTPSFGNTENLDPSKIYRLTNPATGAVIAASDPNDPTSLARLVLQANQMSGNDPTRANWELSQDGNLVASDYPNKSLLNSMLPVAGAALGFLGLTPFLGIGLPAAGGAGAAGATSGVSPAIAAAMAKDAAFTAALGNTAAGISSGLASGALSGGMSIADLAAGAGVAGAGATTGVSPAIASAMAKDAAFTAGLENAAASISPGLASGALPGAMSIADLAAGAGLPGAAADTAGEIVVNAARAPSLIDKLVIPAAASGVTASMLENALANSPQYTPETASQAAPKSTLDKVIDYLQLGGIGVGLAGSLFGGQGSPSLGKYTGAGTALPSNFSSTLPSANIPGLTGATSAPRTAADLANQGLRTNQDWYRYGYGPEQSFFNRVPQAAPNLSKAFTGYAEGGSVDYDYAAAEQAGVRPDEYGHMPDTYKLPNHMTFSQDSIYSTPEHQGGQWADAGDGSWVFWPSEYNMTQHDIPTMERYFRETEQGIPGRPDSYVVYPSDYHMPGYAHGGLSAVSGEGDGREDKIPAMLSDGEYVMDAETVALLGNGSNKAGAKALDDLRVNIRKQKGRKLAKGKFSVNAKKPENYLAGGRI